MSITVHFKTAKRDYSHACIINVVIYNNTKKTTNVLFVYNTSSSNAFVFLCFVLTK